MPVLPFQQGAALPDLSADASPNELSVSGRMLGVSCQQRAARAGPVYLDYRMTQRLWCITRCLITLPFLLCSFLQ